MGFVQTGSVCCVLRDRRDTPWHKAKTFPPFPLLHCSPSSRHTLIHPSLSLSSFRKKKKKRNTKIRFECKSNMHRWTLCPHQPERTRPTTTTKNWTVTPHRLAFIWNLSRGYISFKTNDESINVSIGLNCFKPQGYDRGISKILILFRIYHFWRHRPFLGRLCCWNYDWIWSVPLSETNTTKRRERKQNKKSGTCL